MNLDKFHPYSMEQSFAWRVLFALCSVIIIMASFDALASDVDPVGKALCKVIVLFQSGTAKGIAIVGIIALGVQTIRGKLQWEVALVVITAIIILFKAPDIVNLVSDSNSVDSCITP